MAYWGDAADESDFAFDAIGAYILLLKQRMFQDIATVLDKAHPEQTMVASLTCLRLLGERFPRALSVHFRERDFAFVTRSFDEWLDKAGPQLSAKRRTALADEAKAEFALFEERILSPARQSGRQPAGPGP